GPGPVEALPRLHRCLQCVRGGLPALRSVLPAGTRREADGPLHRARHGLRAVVPGIGCADGGGQRVRTGPVPRLRPGLPGLRRGMRPPRHGPLPAVRRGLPPLRAGLRAGGGV
ncbi:MAG: Uncharacterized cysteine-rich DUF326 protein bsYhjQ/STM1261, partial [uncultured Ramlibacter sp.]